MNISAPFIRRPVATLLTVALALAGAMANGVIAIHAGGGTSGSQLHRRELLVELLAARGVDHLHVGDHAAEVGGEVPEAVAVLGR